ncbi:MAG: sugar phosphate isomerase/epimerase family protein [Tepidisphaeraceae bacterium]
MQIRGHDIGVCSWSLRHGGVTELVAQVRQLGLDHVHVALSPLLGTDEATRHDDVERLRASGLKLTAGMISFADEDYSTIAAARKTCGFVPDGTFEQRRDIARAAATLAGQLGLKLVTTHAGFLPSSSDPSYAQVLSRVCEVADLFTTAGLELLLETGQETASELLQFLNDLRCRGAGVNYDPGNMILYGAGDPTDAVRILGRHIRHVHIKDAILSDQPRMKWGTETPFGAGQVRPARLLGALRDAGYAGPLVIEREGGDDRVRDVRTAIATLQSA